MSAPVSSDKYLGFLKPKTSQSPQPSTSSADASSKPTTGDYYSREDLSEKFPAIAAKMDAVCRIVWKNKKEGDGIGTGFLIGPDLLMTCNHVIPDKETAEKCQAEFYKHLKQVSDESGSVQLTETIQIDLDPDRFFVHSSAHTEMEPADPEHLDYTIVALKHHPHLLSFQERFSLFEQLDPREISKAHVLQFPRARKETLRIAMGNTLGAPLEGYHSRQAFHYHTDTDPGSSGGAVVDTAGRLFALHYQKVPGCKCDLGSNYPLHNAGVSIAAIVEDLKSKKGLEAFQVRSREPLTTLVEERLKQHLVALYSKSEWSTIKLIMKRGEQSEIPLDDYTRIALIDDSERKKKEEDVKKSKPGEVKDGRSPTYETIYETKKAVKLETLFNHEIFKERPNKRALILGSAGIGKSTLCKQIVHEWAQGNLWQDFSAVFCIRLRDLNKDAYPRPSKSEGDYSLYDILSKAHGFNKEISEEQFQTLLKNPSFTEETLVILDGYDELPSETSKDYFARAFNALYKTFAHILVTSRPQPVPIADDWPRLEILGFDKQGIERYVEHFFSSHAKESTGRNLESQLEKLPLVRSLAHIPINLEIFCSLVEKDPQFFEGLSPITRTTLYDKVTGWLFRRFLIERNPDVKPAAVWRSSNIRTINKTVRNIISFLEKTAWAMMEDNTLYITIERIEEILEDFLEEDIDITLEDLSNLGLLKIDEEAGQFIHLTFQEFFAASYLSSFYRTGNPAKGKELLQKYKFYPRFSLVLSMTAGYLSIYNRKNALQAYFDDLFDEPYDLAVRTELNLLGSCFEECSDPTQVKQWEAFVHSAEIYIRKFPFENLIIELLQKVPKLLNEKQIQDAMIITSPGPKKQEEFISVIKHIAQTRQDLPKTTISALIQLLNNPQAHDRTGIAYALGEITKAGVELPKEAIQTLVQVLTDPQADALNRKGAIYALEQVAQAGGELSNEAIQTLVQVLADPQTNAQTREGAIYALKQVAQVEGEPSKEALQALAKVLVDPQAEEGAQGQAAFVLRQIFDLGLELPTEASQALTDPQAEHDAQVIAADALCKITHGEGEFLKRNAQNLIQVISDPETDINTREWAVFDLVQIAEAGVELPKEAVQVLIQVLADPQAEDNAQGWAAVALREVANAWEELPKQATQTLIQVIVDPKADDSVRISASNAISKVVEVEGDLPKETTQALIKIIADPEEDDDIREQTVFLLEEIAQTGVELPKGACQAFLQLLTDTQAGIYARESAASALVEIAKAEVELFKGTMQTLIQLLNNPQAEDKTRELATSTLGEIAQTGGELSKGAAQALIQVLADPQAGSYVQGKAADALGEIAEAGGELSNEATQLFVHVLTDPQAGEYARGKAATALGQVAIKGGNLPKGTAQALVQALIEIQTDGDARGWAAKALVTVAEVEEGFPKEAAQALAHVLADPKANPYSRRMAADALGIVAKTGGEFSKEVVQTLVNVIADPQPNLYVRLSTADTLGEVVQAGGELPKEFVQALIRVLADPLMAPSREAEKIVSVVEKFAQAGGKLPKEAAQTLAQFLANREADDDFRENVAAVLGKFAQTGGDLPKEAAQAILQFLADPRVGLHSKKEAIRALNLMTSSNLADLAQDSSAFACVLEICAISARAVAYWKKKLTVFGRDGGYLVKDLFKPNLEGIEKFTGINPISWRKVSK